jgi:ABC-2 type transport system ATP-binding protein
MTQALLETEHLTKDYGSFRALSALNLQVAPGEIVGLLGPNGSGKSTALRLILGFLKPTAGQARIGGFDCWSSGVEARKRVAYLPGELRLYDSMTGRRLVTFLGELRGASPGESTGEELDTLAKKLEINIDQPLNTMSSGMKRKIALLAVLSPRVPLIILDEPTNTLDPTMRDELLEQLQLARERGQAVLFSSHVLQEVEAICDRVAFLQGGKLAHLQSMAELREHRRVSTRLAGSVPTQGPDGKPLAPEAVAEGRLELFYSGPLPALLHWLSAHPMEDLKIEPMGLEAIYRRIHG